MPTSLAVIFDVDGVLVDSYHAHFASWRRLAAEENRSMTEQQFAATFGRTSREVIAQLWSDGQLSDERIAELDERKESLYRQILLESFPAMDGALQLIQSLAEAQFRLGVGSSGPPENVQLVLDRVDPDRKIQAVVTGEEVSRGKPDPEVYQLAAERLGVPPHFCAVVEDAPAGIKAAYAAGMHAIALVSTGRTRHELHSAEMIVGSLRELTPAAIRSLLEGA